ncbi:TIGR04086 family membrane protein [Alloiococcus sp. CFN-8]|uniref:TIGR04086 family membrane protein n=1 Tax=Alloiococcus sp. CFN-8 TaxID=3416081 RepID=UPI003CF76FDB
MNNSIAMRKIIKGVVFALITTFIGIFLLSLAMIFLDISPGTNVIVNIIITAVSVFLGTVYSARAINRNGWMIGFFVALGYILCIFIFYAVLNGGVELSITDLYRTIMALAVGIFSGMLGINL